MTKFLIFMGMGMAMAALGADDPGARVLRQQQLQRQQQQEALQLRMQQQQSTVQRAPQDTRQRRTLDQLQVEQRQGQQELHYRQGAALSTAGPMDDAGVRRAKENLDLQRAQQEGQELLRQPEKK